MIQIGVAAIAEAVVERNDGGDRTGACVPTILLSSSFGAPTLLSPLTAELLPLYDHIPGLLLPCRINVDSFPFPKPFESPAYAILTYVECKATHDWLKSIEAAAISFHRKLLTRSLLILYTRQFARTTDRAMRERNFQ
jgi:hypothetical protein